MSELKSKHMWAMAADFTAPKTHDEDEEGNPTDFNTPDFVVRAMLDDLRALEAERDELQQKLAGVAEQWLKVENWLEIDKLKAELAQAQAERDALRQELALAQEWEDAEPGRIYLDAGGDNMNIAKPGWIEWLGGNKIIVVMETLSARGTKRHGHTVRVRGEYKLMRRKEATDGTK